MTGRGTRYARLDAGARRRPNLLLLLAVAAAGAVAMWANVRYRHIDNQPPVQIIFIGLGLVAWWLRPENRTGRLMVATGFGFWVVIQPTDPPWLFSLIAPVNGLGPDVLIYSMLAFPHGRLRRRWEWVVVACYALANQGLPIFLVPFTDPNGDICKCPHENLWLVSPHNEWVKLWGDWIDPIAFIWLAPVLITVLLVRVVRASPPARRVIGPVLVISAISLIDDNVLHAIIFGFLGTHLGFSPSHATVDLLSTIDRGTALLLPLGFLSGMAMRRRLRGRVSRLVVELGESPSAAGLERALRRALGDPALRVGIHDPGSGEYLQSDGSRMSIEGEADHLVATRLERAGEPLALMIHDQALLDDPHLVESAAAAARLAVDNERLQAQLRAQLDEVRASRARLVEVSDAERRRMERDLHDGAQQQLLTLSLALGRASERAASAGDPKLRTELADAVEMLGLALAELRELARGIHPSILTEEGLGPALRSLARRAPIPVEVKAIPERRYAVPVEAAAYFVVSEALANVARHAGAERAVIEVGESGGSLHVVVRDDGVGGADPQDGTGLRGLEDRVAALNGSLTVERAPGQGTCVTAEFAVLGAAIS